MRVEDERDPVRPDTVQFLIRLLRWRKWVLLNTAGVAVLAVIISLLLPNWYAARTSILPPQEETLSIGALTRGLGSALSAVGAGGLSVSGSMSLPMWATPSDLLATILRSRRLREQVIREHDLMRVYKCDNIDAALGTLAERVSVRVGAEGVVRLQVLDKDPARAAAVAASSVRILDTIRRETRHSGAADARAFIAARVDSTRRDLATAEEALRVFQARYGLLVPEDQARALVETVAKVEAERLATQVARDALAAQVGRTHPEVQRLDAELRSFAEARASLEGRAGSSRGEAALAPGTDAGQPAEAPRSAIIDLGRLPDLSLSFLRLYREVEIQQTLYSLLVQMFEQYRIQEVRDTPTIQVLDAPVPPIEKARPHRGVICVVATMLAFLLSVWVAVGLERLALLAEYDPERYAHVQRLLRGVGLGFLARR